MKKILSLLTLAILLVITVSGRMHTYPTNKILDYEEDIVVNEYEWEMAGTWYPQIDQYTGWYNGCVMKIGELEDGMFKATFTIDGEVYFDEYVEYKTDYPRQRQFVVKKDSSIWNDIPIIFKDGVVFADQVGTRSGCKFEKR